MGGATDLEKSLLPSKVRNWKSPLIILGFECLESTAFYGVASNLVTYLSIVLHESNSESATSAATWTGTSYLTPLFGAVLADAVLGNYKTTVVSAILYVMGMLTITMSALLPSLSTSTLLGPFLPSLTAGSPLNSSLVFYAGLYMVAFGSGGIKSALLPLGAEQFDDQDPHDARRKGAFFSSFYICLTVGVLIASTGIVWVQENISWVLGFGISTACVALGTCMFLLGTPGYKIQKPTGSPLKSLLQVLVASVRKMRTKVPVDSSLLFEVQGSETVEEDDTKQTLTHTDEFSFLDKAAVLTDSDIASGEPSRSWRLCTVTQVEELKMLLRMVPIWFTSIVFSIACSQIGTTYLEQGEAMDTRIIGSFSIPPASLPAFEVLCVIGWTVLYDRVIVPVMGTYTHNPRGLSVLQQMGLGRLLIILAMAMTAFTEMKRLEYARAGKMMNIAWQLPQYFLIGGADALNYIGQLEFFYDQSPDSMKSMGTALNLLSVALGNYGSSFMVSIVGMFTTTGGNPGWIPEDLNEGHLDYFFWGLATISTLNFVIHVACSNKYTLKQVTKELCSGNGGSMPGEDGHIRGAVKSKDKWIAIPFSDADQEVEA